MNLGTDSSFLLLPLCGKVVVRLKAEISSQKCTSWPPLSVVVVNIVQIPINKANAYIKILNVTCARSIAAVQH